MDSESFEFFDQQRLNLADAAFGFPAEQVLQENPKLSISKQRTNLAEVRKLSKDATTIVEKFESSSILEEILFYLVWESATDKLKETPR